MHWSRIKFLMAGLVLYAIVPMTECRAISMEQEHEALMWLATNAIHKTLPANDMLAFTIATGYHIYSEPLVCRADGACIEKLIRVIGSVASEEAWTNDNISALCLLGMWTKKKFTNHPISSQAEAASQNLASLYAGTNVMTKTLLSWIENQDAPITKYLSEAELEGLLSSSLVDLVERDDAIVAAFFLLEYLWKDTEEGAFDQRLKKMRDLIFIQAESAWNDTGKHYHVKDSSRGPFFDTCLILMLRGGYYGFGPVRLRPSFASPKECP